MPLKIIITGKGVLRGAKKYLNNIKTQQDLLVIDGATHYFNDRDSMQETVFKNSENWFRKL